MESELEDEDVKKNMMKEEHAVHDDDDEDNDVNHAIVIVERGQGRGLGRGGFRDDFWSRFGSDLAIAIRHEMGAN